MAHYFLFPEKDATIFNKRNMRLKNSGKDEILEIEKSYEFDISLGDYVRSVSRTLIQFDLSEVSASLLTASLSSYDFKLNLKTVEAKEVPLKYNILAFPISESWEMGVGRKYDDYTTEGVSWKYRDFADATGQMWVSGSSITDDSGGGTWLSGSYTMSQSFNYQASDICMDVNVGVKAWLSGQIPNEGFVLMHSGEPDNHDYMQLRFFSMDTNTIYSPYIDIRWDDSVFNTGSLLPISESVDRVVAIKNVQKEYRQQSKVKFQVFSREKYPQKTFGRTSDYFNVKYLPQTTYYSIKDAESEEVIVDFDEYSKVSCSPDGNYFFVDMGGLPQERHFKLIIKVVENDQTNFYDGNTIFKITR